MQHAKYLFNAKGFSLVEGMIAASLVVASAVALGNAIMATYQSREKALIVSDAMELDSIVVNSLQNVNSFITYVPMLKLGNLEQFKIDFRLSSPTWGGGQLQIGNTKFRKDKSVCTNCSEQEWAYRLVLDVAMLSPPPNVAYGFAYHIEANGQTSTMGSLGFPTTDGVHFALSSYKMMIPETLFSQSLRCAADGIIASGVDLTTGQMHCWKQPNIPGDHCAAGSIPIGLQIVADRIAFKCLPMRSLGCDDLYVVNRLSPSTLGLLTATPTLAGSCVFIAQDSVPAKSNPATANIGQGVTGTTLIGGELYGTFCPQGYRAVIEECTAILGATATTPSRCPTGYPNSCPTSVQDPAVPDGAWYGAAATYDGPLVSPVIPAPQDRIVKGDGSTIYDPLSPNLNKAFCRLNNPVQAGGAGWSGNVRMRVRCDLVVAKYSEPKFL